MRWLALVVFCLLAYGAQAQEYQTQVTFIAGQSVYVDVGSDEGLVSNDTLRVSRNGVVLGEMIVISASSSRSVLGFKEAPFSITLGDQLLLYVVASQRMEPTEPEAPPDTDRPSILEEQAVQETTSLQPRLTGRFQVGIDGLRSSTKAVSGGVATDRTFATPFALFRGTLDQLPGNFSLNAHVRAAYRYSDPIPLSEETDIRVYRLSATKSFDSLPLTIQAGRFYNAYDRFSGYWDGLNLHVGSRQQGLSLSVGAQPINSNESPSSDLPKFSLVGHLARSFDDLRYEGSLLGGQVIPSGDSLSTRTYIGTHQRISSGSLRLSAEALLDQDPASDEWTFSRLGGRVSATPAPAVRLRAFANSRRSYIILGDRQDLLDRSTRFGGGISISPRSGPVRGASIRADVSHASTEGQISTMTYSGGVSIPRIPSLNAGLSVDATLWQQDERQGVFGGAYVTRSFGSMYSRLGYRYNKSPLFNADDIVTNGLEGLIQLPLNRRTSFTIQASTNFNDRLSSSRIYTALWVRL